jgi:dihydrofolate synthase/folylpolyglutamate synthase
MGQTVLGGNYQTKNLQAVFAVFNILKDVFEVSKEDIINGVRNVMLNTGLNGRWQVLGISPLTICDTGHNREGLIYVLDQISHIRKSGLHIVLGFVNDKDLGSVLPLFPTSAKYYFTKAEKYGLKGESYPSVKAAFDSAKKCAEQTDLIFIGGSTFIVAEAI